MVARNQRLSGPAQPQLFELQSRVVVNVIEVQEREQPGVGAGSAKVHPYVGALQMRTEQARCQSASPFVEVSQDDSRRSQAAVDQQPGSDQLAALLTAFERRGPEVHV